MIPALPRRVIDAAEWSMSCIDKKMGFHDVCKYLIIPGVHQPSSLDEPLIYKKSWDSLPADLKAIFWTAARDSSLYIMTRETELNPPAMKFFNEKRIPIISVSSEVLRIAKSLAEELFKEKAAADPFFAKVLSSQRRFSKTWLEYAEVS